MLDLMWKLGTLFLGLPVMDIQPGHARFHTVGGQEGDYPGNWTVGLIVALDVV